MSNPNPSADETKQHARDADEQAYRRAVVAAILAAPRLADKGERAAITPQILNESLRMAETLLRSPSDPK